MSAGLSELTQALFPSIVGRARPETARGLMLAAGALYFALNRRERKRVEASVADLLGPGERAEETKRKVFGQILEHYFEKLLVANRSPAFLSSYLASRVEARGLERLDAAAAPSR